MEQLRFRAAGNETIEVSKREKVAITFDFDKWLSVGESITAATALLTLPDRSGSISAAVGTPTISGGDSVIVTVDFANVGIMANKSYRLWMVATITGDQTKEGFVDLKLATY